MSTYMSSIDPALFSGDFNGSFNNSNGHGKGNGRESPPPPKENARSIAGKNRRTTPACDRCFKDHQPCTPSDPHNPTSDCVKCIQNHWICLYTRPKRRRGPGARYEKSAMNRFLEKRDGNQFTTNQSGQLVNHAPAAASQTQQQVQSTLELAHAAVANMASQKHQAAPTLLPAQQQNIGRPFAHQFPTFQAMASLHFAIDQRTLMERYIRESGGMRDDERDAVHTVLLTLLAALQAGRQGGQGQGR